MTEKKITSNVKQDNGQDHSFGFTLLDRAGWILKVQVFFLKQLGKVQSVFQMKPDMCQILNYIANTNH